MIKAVLDTNVFVAALLSEHGAPAELLQRWRAGEFEIVVSPKLLDEMRRTFAYPKLRKVVIETDAAEYVDSISAAAIRVIDPAPSLAATDPKDDFLLALAASAADVLVTGDAALARTKGCSVPILSPREFVHELA